MLSLFSAPLNGLVLRALVDGPCQLGELRELVGWPPPSTLRGNLEGLVKIGAIRLRRSVERINSVDHALTPLGEELVEVAEAIDSWLARAPGGSLALGDRAAKAALGALADGWDTAMIRALAAGPLTLAELDALIASTNYPALWRRLGAMRATGQVERRTGKGSSHAYGVTDWLREALVPLVLCARAEHRHLRGLAAPVTRVEVESAFLLALPLVNLPGHNSGPCTLAVDTGAPLNGSARSRVAGARVEVRDGQIISCSTRLLDGPGTWALGTAEGWLNSVIDSEGGAVSCGGAEPELAFALLEGIRQALGPVNERALS